MQNLEKKNYKNSTIGRVAKNMKYLGWQKIRESKGFTNVRLNSQNAFRPFPHNVGQKTVCFYQKQRFSIKRSDFM